MSAAMLLQAWGDTLVTTAALVLAILVIRKPFARHFGPRLAYALWAVPALRLLLPPLPFADPVPAEAVAVAQPGAELVYLLPADWPEAAPAAAVPLWSFADLLPFLFAVWVVGLVAVLAAALLAHRRFRREVLTEAVALEPIGTIRLVMSEAVDGPVAFGLWRRYVAVPRDFFARYAAEERALAIDHELAHHRHFDLWANAAALLLLAVQWFNPFAWRAIRAFRFDQEAACDARVLTMEDAAARSERTARYATAIAKAAVGSRLSLAAPMAVHDNLQERLTMLMRQDISRERGLVGRLLVGGTALAVLATTATLVPAGIATAKAQSGELAAPPAPPAPPADPDAPPPAVERKEQRIMIVTTGGETSETVSEDGKTREVTRIVVRNGEQVDGKGKVMVFAPGAPDGAAPHARRFELRMPGTLSRDDILATLREQGVTGKRAEAIADKLEAKRKEGFRTALAPMPPIPPIPPVPPMNWSAIDGKSFAIAHCAKGEVPIVDREDRDGNQRNRVMMLRCGDGGLDKAAQAAALKKARDRFAQGEASKRMSDDIRAKVVADLDKAIAELEKAGD
ncbi:MAG TPA: M56 family metallopeptidase [Sphingopyxis sp.]|nr:M56 family metallopeptidase [Sphingopyxis sp.]HMP44192.1 M56 family metallopeptidase [Sphingopyxis sp.]HMQ18149.1 M56 family metallopeptidase [Sphingopyxis sp.]